jgi:hypothetical protein
MVNCGLFSIVKNLNYSTMINEHQKENQLGYYLAGLIEVDGSIIVPENERSKSGKLRYPYFKIIFYIKDLPLAKKLVDILGYGTISEIKNSNYCVVNLYRD